MSKIWVRKLDYSYMKKSIRKYLTVLLVKFGRWIPDYYYLSIYSVFRNGQKINLKNPQTYNEKINWLKLNSRQALMTKCSDKFKVREYVKDKIGEKYLIPLIWVGEKPEEIPFNQLPDKFVIKTNHASGTNIIIKNKRQVNREEVIKQLNQWLNKNYYYPKREWAYKNINRKIIIEEFIGEDNQVPEDYKLFTFNGQVHLIQVDHNRETNHTRSLYSENWTKLNYTLEYPIFKGLIDKPDNLSDLIYLAEKLSKDFIHARIDFYNIKGEIYFGEITFYHGAGFEKFIPNDKKWNMYYGRLLKIK